MATSIWDVATEGASAFDIYGNASMSDIELSYEDRTAIGLATESDTGFVDYINDCQMSLMQNASMTFAQESVAAIQVAHGTSYSTAMEGLKTIISDAWEAIKKFLAKVWATIKEYAKKAKDYFARRASLGKAMLTKYSSVLRNKKIDTSIKFKWADIDIEGFTKQRASWMQAYDDPEFRKKIVEVDALFVKLAEVLKNKNLAQNDRDTLENNKRQIEKTLADLENIWKQMSNAYDGATLANEMDRVLYNNATSNGEGLAKYEDRSWNEIQDKVMKWADLDTTRYLNECLGIFEKDSQATLKLINQTEQNSIKAVEGAESAEIKKYESAIRTYIKQLAQAQAKFHKMYIYRLKNAISLQQAQAIAAARKAILAKGTTSESFTIDNLDFIY